jgi:predicted transcriptional regulator
VTSGRCVLTRFLADYSGMSQKESVLDAVRRLPEDMRFKDAIEEIRILERIEEGERAADDGRVRPHEDVRALIRKWAGK